VRSERLARSARGAGAGRVARYARDTGAELRVIYSYYIITY